MTFALLPFAFVMALATTVVLENAMGLTLAFLFAESVLVVCILFRFGISFLGRTPHSRSSFPMNEKIPPLKDRINQVLTECRVVIPGTQALLGFQLIAFLMDAFDKLPKEFKLLHVTALGCILVAAAFLMLPAAFHRVGENGRNTEGLLRISNASLTAAMAILAAGLGIDFFVVVYRVSSNISGAVVAAAATFIFLIALWYVIPLIRRSKIGAMS